MQLHDPVEAAIFEAGVICTSPHEGWDAALQVLSCLAPAAREVDFGDFPVWYFPSSLSPLVAAAAIRRRESCGDHLKVVYRVLRSIPTPRGDHDTVIVDGLPGIRGSILATVVCSPEHADSFKVKHTGPWSPREFPEGGRVEAMWREFKDGIYGC